MKDAYAQKINDLIVNIYNAVMDVESNMLSNTKLDISISELHILETVWKKGERGCTVSDIAQAHQITLPSVTVAVKKLEKKGYVRKSRSIADKRVVYVELTRMGGKVNSMHRYFHEKMVRAFERDASEEQMPILVTALKNLYDFLKRQLQAQDTALGRAAATETEG